MALAGLLLVCVSALLCLAAADEQCATSGTDLCKCSTTNLTLDLRQMGLSFPVTIPVQENKYEVTYQPCDPQVCQGGSGEKSVMCQLQNSNKVVFSLGRTQNFQWLITQFSPLQFELHYGGGDGDRKSYVHFKSGTGATVFSSTGEKPKLTYNFQVLGSKVAPVSSGGSSTKYIIEGPIGLTIILLALCGFVGYLVVGGIFMYTQRGARGMEVIPNYSFWKELPFLLKDGFFFVISPVYKRDKYQGL